MAVLLATLLAWPCVRVGWFGDDILHRAAYSKNPAADGLFLQEGRLKGPMRMYSFFSGDREILRQAVDLGGVPWWCDLSEIRAAFWRPLTALFSMVDYWLWPDSSALMHMHSMAWFVGLVMLAAAAYRNFLGAGWAAGLAVLLFAVNDTQAVPIAFLANRHILVGAVFGVLAVWAHDRGRRLNQIHCIILAPAAYLLALLSSESGVAVFAYLLAYALWLETGPVRARCLSLLPYLLLTMGWRILYTSLGYGISGMELYVDPGIDPAGFALAVVERVPLLLLGILAFPSPELYALLTPFAVRLYWITAVIVLAGLAVLFYPAWRGCRLARFWLTGTVLAVVPLCAAWPGGRSLALAAFGGMGLLAQTAKNAFPHASSLDQPTKARVWPRRILGLILLVRLLTGAGHLHWAPMALDRMQKGIELISMAHQSVPDQAGKTVIFVNHPVPLVVAYLFPIRLLNGDPLPERLRVLAPGLDPVELSRTGEKTLVVRPRNGYAGPPQWKTDSWTDRRTYVDLESTMNRVERLLLGRKTAPARGQKLDLTGVTIEITTLTGDQRPAEAKFVFKVPLEDPSLCWLAWNRKTWKLDPFPLPRVGETVMLD
ncbi:MAG: hypothetical protein ACE15F_08195 [bacterium]